MRAHIRSKTHYDFPRYRCAHALFKPQDVAVNKKSVFISKACPDFCFVKTKHLVASPAATTPQDESSRARDVVRRQKERSFQDGSEFLRRHLRRLSGNRFPPLHRGTLSLRHRSLFRLSRYRSHTLDWKCLQVRSLFRLRGGAALIAGWLECAHLTYRIAGMNMRTQTKKAGQCGRIGESSDRREVAASSAPMASHQALTASTATNDADDARSIESTPLSQPPFFGCAAQSSQAVEPVCAPRIDNREVRQKPARSRRNMDAMNRGPPA